ncbi:hypothetical protein Bbelb_301290 [Branchiostoma belcheri]|nr:hypothetical protein Bbelb_301290 [Branchiostoma belcheri]
MSFRATLFVVFSSLFVIFTECSVDDSSPWERDLSASSREGAALRAVECWELVHVTTTATSPTPNSLDISHPRDIAKSAEERLTNNPNTGTQKRPPCSYVFLWNIGKHTSTGTHTRKIKTTRGTAAPPTAGRDGITLNQGRHDDDTGVTGPHSDENSGMNHKRLQNKPGRVAPNLDSLREVLEALNVLGRKRREATSSSANDVIVRRSASVRGSLISKACCRAGRHFGGNPEIADCSGASDRFVSGNIAVLTDLRRICVGHFVDCCKAKQNELRMHRAGPEIVPEQRKEITDNHSEEENEDESPLPEPPTEQSTRITTHSEVQLAYACCLNGRRTAYDLAKRCEEERDVYLNQTARSSVVHTAEALAGCRMEFGRCCDGQRDALKAAGDSRASARKSLANLRGLQLKQHCCRQGSIQGLAPETDCTQSAREFAWRPLKSSPGRRAQCSGEYKQCCALRQEQNRKVARIRNARKGWQQRAKPTVATLTGITQTTDKDTSSKRPSHNEKNREEARIRTPRKDRQQMVTPSVTTSNQTRDIADSSERSSQSSVTEMEEGPHLEIPNADHVASTATPYQHAEEIVPLSARRASSETKSSGANREKAENLKTIGSPDKRVKSSSRSERSKKAAKAPKSSAKGRRRTRRRHRVVRTRPGPPAGLLNDGLRPTTASPPDIAAVLDSHRRVLRLCCMHGGRVDPNVFEPRSCSLEADSYARGTRLTGPVRTVCQEVYEHCCQTGNETHPGHAQHPGHGGGAARSPGRKVRQFVKNRRRKWAKLFQNSKSVRSTG